MDVDTIDDLDDFVEGAADELMDVNDVDVSVAIDRLLYKVRQIERRIDRDKALAKSRTDLIREWLEKRLAVHTGALVWPLRSLENLMREHNEATGVKTVKVPAGEARIRPAQVTVEKVDAHSVVMWADTIGVDGLAELFVEWEPKVPASIIKSWCVPGPAVDGPDERGYQSAPAMFVPALVVPYLVPFVILPSVRADVPGVTLSTPTRAAFGMTTMKHDDLPIVDDEGDDE